MANTTIKKNVKIKLLEKTIAERIAAGEVIERPLSVVKELVENAIDAKSDRIELEIKNMGLDFIKVSDNGIGMSKEELKLSIQRHATSKIETLEDLEKIRTLGFRGEALPSIASVSKLEIISRSEEEDIGNSLSMSGGEDIKCESKGAPIGTQIIIQDLFYNTPARKKFLKSKTTESAYIYEVIESLALAYPDINFNVISDSKKNLILSKAKNRGERIKSVFGKDMLDKLIPVKSDNSFIKISGYISNTEYSVNRRSKQYIFLNNRLIQSKVISGAINQAYQEYMIKGKYPVIFLFIDMQGTLFDVNVHPRKMEVKFINEPGLYSVINKVITVTLNEYKDNKLGKAGFEFKEKQQEINKSNFRNVKEKTKFVREPEVLYSALKQVEKIYSQDKNSIQINKAQEIEASTIDDNQEKEQDNSIIEKYETGDMFGEDLLVLSWLPDKYILVQNRKKDLLIIDQHAAHERILYEKFKKEYKNTSIASQGVLIPVVLELPSHLSIIMHNNMKQLDTLGFGIEEFGKDCFVIKSVPHILNIQEEKSLVIDILDQLMDFDNKKNSFTEEIADKIIKTACKHAYKAKDKLSLSEMNMLVKDLLRCENPHHCPHGRPTMIIMTLEEIDKKFKRK